MMYNVWRPGKDPGSRESPKNKEFQELSPEAFEEKRPRGKEREKQSWVEKKQQERVVTQKSPVLGRVSWQC